AKNVVGKNLFGVGGRFRGVFFRALIRDNVGSGDCQGAQEGRHGTGFHFVFLFPAAFDRAMPGSLAEREHDYNFTTRTLLMSGSLRISSSNSGGGTLSRFSTVKAWPPLLSRLKLMLAMLTLYWPIKVPM